MIEDDRSFGEPEGPEDSIPVDGIVYYEAPEEPPTVVTLERSDYVALFIAALETIFLPLVILGVSLFVVGILLGVLG